MGKLLTSSDFSRSKDGKELDMLWIDISDLFVWDRPPVGIIRTVIETTKYIILDVQNETGLCRYHNGCFSAVTTEEFKDRVELISGRKTGQDIPKQTESAKDKLRVIYSRVLGKFPKAFEPIFQLVCKKVLFPVLKVVWKVLCKIKIWVVPVKPSFGNPSQSVDATIHFGQGDSFLSANRDWEYPGKLELLTILRNEGLFVVLFCYDIIPSKRPNYMFFDSATFFNAYFCNMAWAADKVLAISNSTRLDFIALLNDLGAPVPSTKVVILGTSPLDVPVKDEEDSLGINEPFLLFVSTLEKRKNHDIIYRAYIYIVEVLKIRPPKCIFVGMEGWGVSETLNNINLDPRVKDLFQIFNHVTDAQLIWLYHNCLFTVYPSLYEGWGLPIAESLSYGKFVLSSNNSSLPEVGGDLIEYLDAWDYQGWGEAIVNYCSNQGLLAEKEYNIRAKYHPVKWEECASQIMTELRGS